MRWAYHQIYALTDGLCRPIAFLPTGGQVADYTAADLLLEQTPKSPMLLGDTGYDTNAIRQKVEGRGAMPKSAEGQSAPEELLLATSIGIATRSSACLVGSRTSAARHPL